MEKSNWAVLKLNHEMRSPSNLVKEPTFSDETTKYPQSYECKIFRWKIGRVVARMGANFIYLFIYITHLSIVIFHSTWLPTLIPIKNLDHFVFQTKSPTRPHRWFSKPDLSLMSPKVIIQIWGGHLANFQKSYKFNILNFKQLSSLRTEKSFRWVSITFPVAFPNCLWIWIYYHFVRIFKFISRLIYEEQWF